MKSSANGLSSSLITRGLESSMHANAKFRTDAVACQAELCASPEVQGTEAVSRLALAARGAMLVNAEREAGKFATSWRSTEQTGLAIEACAGSLRSCVKTSCRRAR